MSVLTVEPAVRGLTGIIRVPGDKSISHRALMLSAVADGSSRLRGLSDGDDVRRTATAIEKLGAEVISSGAMTKVTGRGSLSVDGQEIDCGNSGTGMRLLAGLLAGYRGTFVLDGDESLRRRPMDRVAEPLGAMGARVAGHGESVLPPLRIAGGNLRGIEYQAPVASAQVKSAVLLGGLRAQGETTVVEPVPTRRHTEEMLARAGVVLEIGACPYRVSVSRQSVAPFDFDVPADPSQAAFWVVAATLIPGSDVILPNVYVGYGRAGFLDVLKEMGAEVELEKRDASTADIRVRSARLRSTSMGPDVSAYIDEIPVLAVAAAAASGTTTIEGAHELRVKESDRISTTTNLLQAFGIRVESRSDGLRIEGGLFRGGGRVDSSMDHRVAMSAAVAALAATKPVEIEGWQSVETSYPGFEKELQRCR